MRHVAFEKGEKTPNPMHLLDRFVWQDFFFPQSFFVIFGHTWVFAFTPLFGGTCFLSLNPPGLVAKPFRGQSGEETAVWPHPFTVTRRRARRQVGTERDGEQSPPPNLPPDNIFPLIQSSWILALCCAP